MCIRDSGKAEQIAHFAGDRDLGFGRSSYYQREHPAKGAEVIDRDILKQLVGREASDGLVLSAFLSISSLDDWRQTVPTFLNSEFRRMVRAEGLAVFVDMGSDLLESWELPLRMTNRLIAEPVPYIRPLIHTLSLLEPFVVARVSRDESALFVVDEWRVSQGEEIIGPYLKSTNRETGDVPVKEYYAAARQESLVDQHFKDVALALEKLLKKTGISRVVLAGQHEIANSFRRALSPYVGSRVAGEVSWSPSLSTAQLAVSAREALTQTRRREKEEWAQRIAEARGAKGMAAVGLDEVIGALHRGQVRMLLVDRAYRPGGWRCPGCGYAGVSSTEVCPVCGSAVTVSGDVVGEAIRIAIVQGTFVEVAEDIPMLSELGSIAGLLRYG